MKLTKLDEDNIRILLEKEDLVKFDISLELISEKSAATKEAFWKIVNAARDHSGFDPSRNKVLIEAFPKSNGEVLLYVTRLPECPTDRQCDGGKSYLFSFKGTDAFLGGYNELMNSRLEIMEKRYYCCGSRRYLWFQPVSISRTDEMMLDRLLLSLSEFGSEVGSQGYRYYLEEHSTSKCSLV